jgi:integrase
VTLNQSFRLWLIDEMLADYSVKKRANSTRYLKQRIVHIKKHLGNLMLIEIDDQTISDYQSLRIAEGAAGSTINSEVMFTLRLMSEMGDAVRSKLHREKKLRLSKNEDCGKVLSQKQEEALLAAARVPEVPEGEKMDLKATRSPAIFPAVMLALNTAMRESEIRTLRWGQIDFLKRLITVGKAKTSAGTGRTIPINLELFQTLAEHKGWFEDKVCPVSPDLYVFPFGDCRQYEPKRPISSLKTSWANVRNKAGLGIRFHDLRHTSITKLAESGAGEETIMSVAGHVSRTMLSRYAHIRIEAKRKALEAISTKPAVPSNEIQPARVAS